MMDYLLAKFGDFSFSRFGFVMRTDRQTDRQSSQDTSAPGHFGTGAEVSVPADRHNHRLKDRITEMADRLYSRNYCWHT